MTRNTVVTTMSRNDMSQIIMASYEGMFIESSSKASDDYRNLAWFSYGMLVWLVLNAINQ